MSLLQVRDLSVIANNAGHDVTLVDRVAFDLAEGEWRALGAADVERLFSPESA